MYRKVYDFRTILICFPSLQKRRCHKISVLHVALKHVVWLMQFNLIYIKRTNVIQLGSMFICNYNIALHVLDTFCIHLQEHLATVEAACGE